VGEMLGAQLLSVHNLRFLIKLTEDIKKAIWEDRLLDFKDEFYNKYGKETE
jgi:queuine tRNA-ribosyltransferase